MGLKLDLVLWLGEKLNVKLKDYFRPSTVEEIADLIEEQAETESSPILYYLEGIAENLDIDLEEEYDSNPVETIYDLDDESGKMYIWKLPDDWSEEQRDNLFARLSQSYYEKYREEPQAAHLFLTELEELKEVSRDELKDMMGYAAKDLEV